MTVSVPWNSVLSYGLPIIAIAVSVIFYFLKSRNSRALWKTGNIYDKIFDEIVDLEEDSKLPGSQGDRLSESGVSDLSRTQISVMDPELRDELGQYKSLLEDLENAEQELERLIPKITKELPELWYSTKEDSLRIVVTGVAGDQIDVKNKEEISKQGVLKFTRPILSLFNGIDRSELDVDSPNEVRELLAPDDEPPEDIDLNNEYGEIGTTNPSHHTIVFWDENFPDWDQIIFQLLENDLLEEYLVARQKKENCIGDLEDSTEILRKQIGARLPASK